MKKIYIIRHAKSSWSNFALRDFDRPLKKRGEKSIEIMGRGLKGKNIKPDLIISSPAKRTKMTAVGLGHILGYKLKHIIYSELIYESSLKNILSLLSELKDDKQEIFLVGHNPCCTLLAEYLTKVHIRNMPTCGVVCINITKQTLQKALPRGCGTLDFFDFPKNYLDQI